MNQIQKIIIAIGNEPKKVVINGFTCFAVIWTFFEAIIYFLIPDNTFGIYTKRWIFILLLCLISFIYGVYTLIPKRRVIIFLGSKLTPIEIKFGDIFLEKGIIAIPSSQYFESEIEKFISPKCLQAQLINIEYEGNRSKYKEDIEKTLSKLEFKEFDRGMGIEKRYPKGSIASLSIGRKKYLHFALTETEIKKFEPMDNADIFNLVMVLKELWKEIKNTSNGSIVNIPLIGDGITGIGLPSRQLLDLNLIVANNELQGNHNISKVNILLNPKDEIETINLNKVLINWQSK